MVLKAVAALTESRPPFFFARVIQSHRFVILWFVYDQERIETMTTPTRKLGFGDTRQTADHFGLSEDIVVDKAERGEWPSWFVGGRRVFDLDEIVSILVGTDRRAACP